MKQEKTEEGLREVLEEIETALRDPRGLIAHQRRLAFSVSLGASLLVELYFHKKEVLKPGGKINHLWFRKQEKTILETLQHQITSPIKSLPQIDIIIELAKKIEEKRDDLAYGTPAEEKVLQEKIKLFLRLKEVTA